MDSTLRWFLSFVFAGPYSSVLPFAVLPPFSSWLIDHVFKRAEQSSLAPTWRAVAGAVGVCVPGLVTLSLVSFSVHYIPRISPEDFGCYVKIYGPLCIVLALLLRAILLLVARSYQVRRLADFTTAPSERLARLAAEIRVPTLEFPANAPVCMTVGFFSPRVIVSTGTLSHFSDEDLRAALLHERVHVAHGHTRLRTFISFFGECSLRRATNAWNAYGQACEELADQAAAKEVGAIALAEVLIRFSRVSWNLPFAEAFAQTKGLDQRVSRLLESRQTPCRSTALILFFALLLTASLMAYPQWACSVAHCLFNCLP